MDKFRKATAAFLASLASIFAAWLALMSNRNALLVLVVALFLFAVFSSAFYFGKGMLPGDPVRAVKQMDLSIGSYWVVSVLGPALVIVLGVQLVAGEQLAKTDAKLLGLAVAALITFVATLTQAFTGKGAEEHLAQRIQKAFKSKYKRPTGNQTSDGTTYYFGESSPGERWVQNDMYQGARGWGPEARWKRAAGIAEEMRRHEV